MAAQATDYIAQDQDSTSLSLGAYRFIAVLLFLIGVGAAFNVGIHVWQNNLALGFTGLILVARQVSAVVISFYHLVAGYLIGILPKGERFKILVISFTVSIFMVGGYEFWSMTQSRAGIALNANLQEQSRIKRIDDIDKEVEDLRKNKDAFVNSSNASANIGTKKSAENSIYAAARADGSSSKINDLNKEKRELLKSQTPTEVGMWGEKGLLGKAFLEAAIMEFILSICAYAVGAILRAAREAEYVAMKAEEAREAARIPGAFERLRGWAFGKPGKPGAGAARPISYSISIPKSKGLAGVAGVAGAAGAAHAGGNPPEPPPSPLPTEPAVVARIDQAELRDRSSIATPVATPIATPEKVATPQIEPVATRTEVATEAEPPRGEEGAKQVRSGRNRVAKPVVTPAPAGVRLTHEQAIEAIKRGELAFSENALADRIAGSRAAAKALRTELVAGGVLQPKPNDKRGTLELAPPDQWRM